MVISNWQFYAARHLSQALVHVVYLDGEKSLSISRVGRQHALMTTTFILNIVGHFVHLEPSYGLFAFKDH